MAEYSAGQRVTYYLMRRAIDPTPAEAGATVLEDYGNGLKIQRDDKKGPCVVSKDSVRPEQNSNGSGNK